MDRTDDTEDEGRRNATLLLQSVTRNRGNQREVKMILQAGADPNYFNDTHNKHAITVENLYHLKTVIAQHCSTGAISRKHIRS